MSTTPEQIDLWRSVASEHQRLEFKEAKVIKLDEKFGASRKFARYLPFWA